MRFAWRPSIALTSHQQWLSKVDEKNRRQGTSAPTLADVWAGPLAIAGALAGQEGLEDFRPETVTVEAQTKFDANSRGPRNHDLLVVGHAAVGRVVVSVEAKSGEPYGETLGEYLAAGSKTAGSGKADRLEGLLDAFAPKLSLEDQAVLALRWQLLTGLAGAVAAAVDEEAVHAVFLIHEFLTPVNTDKRRAQNAGDLKAFGAAVLGRELPTGDNRWCVGPLAFTGNERLLPSVRLHVAKAVTDLRPSRFDD